VDRCADRRDRTEHDDAGTDQASNRAVAAIEATLTERPLTRRPGRDGGEGHQATAHHDRDVNRAIHVDRPFLHRMTGVVPSQP
jgi:hypothetical protein